MSRRREGTEAGRPPTLPGHGRKDPRTVPGPCRQNIRPTNTCQTVLLFFFSPHERFAHGTSVRLRILRKPVHIDSFIDCRSGCRVQDRYSSEAGTFDWLVLSNLVSCSRLKRHFVPLSVLLLLLLIAEAVSRALTGTLRRLVLVFGLSIDLGSLSLSKAILLSP